MKFYKPDYYSDDGTNIEYKGSPKELTFDTFFLSEASCEEWLIEHDYDPADFVIHEFEIREDNQSEDYIILQ